MGAGGGFAIRVGLPCLDHNQRFTHTGALPGLFFPPSLYFQGFSLVTLPTSDVSPHAASGERDVRRRTVSLIGMPGGGKTTVGRLLARQLGWRFVDSDAEIERALGCSIRDYFAREGEEAFRDIEARTLASVLEHAEGVVLSTGGGMLLRESNRIQLRDRTTALYLHSTPEELFRRLRNDTHRPLLQVVDPLARLRELYGQRDKLYRHAAQFVIETGRPSVNTLVNMVLMQLELAGVVGRVDRKG
jgi:shikimate kinase